MIFKSYTYGFDPEGEENHNFESFYFQYILNEKDFSLILDNCYNSYHKGKDLKKMIEELGIEDPFNKFKKQVNQFLKKVG